ncbi:MAG: cytochrome P450 [Caldilineaceae bacterium SB0675_bin_29]|uniref:Cytochrome P450 n=1 Tax=Caldilineaceae bacterium SB0675_bin_29 TaxID=2605266 RepID=A0A6B1FYZ3_9CHLR|nr:cytochrome P450 [Caldilineaceae bacterium SB0675_bin_29]
MGNVFAESVTRLVTPAAKQVLLTWERLESGISFDLTSRKVRANPYDVYERLRSESPIHRMRLINAWALTEYDDALAILQDHRRFSSGENKLEYAPYRTMLDLDPPDHTRLRSLVSKAFTPRAVAALGPRIQEIVEELLDDLADRDSFDLISDFAFPFPVIVIAEMLGIPAEDRDKFNVWSNDIALAVEPILSGEEIVRGERASDEIIEYFEGIIEQRRMEPRDDMLSALLAAEEEGDRLSHDELLGTLMLLLVAGNETTRSLIGNGMLALLKNPDELQRLREDSDLLGSAIDEMLRYDSPVQIIIRVVLEDTEFKGKRFRAGQKVIILVGAANRDPTVFADPGALDIGRQEKSHISFGRGIHYCLGSPLALLEARVAFANLIERFSSIELVTEPEFRDQIVLRGVESLRIRVERR